MWLSQKINKDPETKKTLRELAKLIKGYSDATEITRQKFWSIDIGRFFRPRTAAYFGIIATMAVLFYIVKFELPDFQELVKSSLLISVPIFVLGITLSTVAKDLDKQSRFAVEYLKESCRTTEFACLTFLTVLAGYFGGLLFENTANLFLPIIFSSFAIGGTIWCLMSLVYILVETTKCMSPEISTKVASNYAARKLIHAFMKKAYFNVWMGRYSDLLEAELKDFENIHSPHESYAKCGLTHYNEESNENKCIINMPKEVDFHLGYRDYNLNKFKKIDKSLKAKNAELYLTGHMFAPKESGVLYYKENCDKLLKSIKRKKFCKRKKDKHTGAKKSFIEDHYLKLRKSLLKTIEEEDASQFKEYLNSVEDIFNAIRNTRKDHLVRKHSSWNYEEYRYLRLYSKSVRWLLEANLKANLEEEICGLFIEEITESIERQAEDDIRNGDWYVLDTFKWILPDTYKLFDKYKGKSLWEMRARIGRFYQFSEITLSEYESEIKKEDKLQIQLTLHKGMISWLLVAIENKDDELIKALCGAERKLVFPNSKIEFTPQELITQHFVLCGKMLKYLMDKTPQIDKKTFRSLLFDEYDHRIANFDYNELAEFYIKNRGRGGRGCLYEFNKIDWERNPLSGSGHGSTIYDFDGGEFDYMFIYMALLKISDKEQIMPVEFSCYNLKEKITNLKGIATDVGMYDFVNQRARFEKWLDDCDALYGREEEARIAEAKLDDSKVTQYKQSFREGYNEVETFLKFCIKQGYYSIDETVSVKGGHNLSKDIFIDSISCSISSIAHPIGNKMSRQLDKELVRGILKSTQENEKETADDIESMLNKACQWLNGKGADETNGIIVYCGIADIDGKLYDNEYYVHSWRNEKEKCFSGYYKNYPIKTIRGREEVEKCVALNLQGWKGFEIRPEAIDKGALGNIDIRERTEDEIAEAIKNSSELEEKDRNKLKGRCLMEYELYCKLTEIDLPLQMEVSLKTDE